MQGQDLTKLLPGEKRCILSQVPESARRIIDIGCGEGLLTYCISTRNTAARVVGIDADNEYIRHAREHHSNTNLEYLHAHLEDADPGQYDVAVLCSVIEHLPNVGANLQALNRIIAMGGCLLVDTDNAHSLKFTLANLYYSVTKSKPSTYLWHNQDRYYWWNHHLYSWTLSTLTTLLALYGFELEGYWFTNHYKPEGLGDRCLDWVTSVVPGMRRHMVLKLRKGGVPTIHERSPGEQGHPIKSPPVTP